MTKQDRIHHLFNELHEALLMEEEAMHKDNADMLERATLRRVTRLVDRLHHDYTTLQLEGRV